MKEKQEEKLIIEYGSVKCPWRFQQSDVSIKTSAASSFLFLAAGTPIWRRWQSRCFIRIIDSRFTFRSISNYYQEFPPSVLAQSLEFPLSFSVSFVSIPVFLLPRPSNKYSHSLALNIEKYTCEQAVFSRHSAFSQLFLGCLLKKKTTNISGCLLPTPMAIDLRHWILPFPFACF